MIYTTYICVSGWRAGESDKRERGSYVGYWIMDRAHLVRHVRVREQHRHAGGYLLWHAEAVHGDQFLMVDTDSGWWMVDKS